MLIKMSIECSSNTEKAMFILRDSDEHLIQIKKGYWLYMKEQSLKWESQFNSTEILVDKSSSSLNKNTCTFTLDRKEGVMFNISIYIHSTSNLMVNFYKIEFWG